ncbi:hypothetical protein TNCV_1812951 [Trichonephila clavipes]|uniref:Uncharacterized protein n=1 Tax=Trichonephila clavipes TaxID=2585209 RepID=A0A8X7BGP9_TRICX|nr:hypothetical protein TNCV_1812951 [Trichonephila clavipes]
MDGQIAAHKEFWGGPPRHYNGNSGGLALITIRAVEVAANQGTATILREDIASTISDSGRSASLVNAYSRAASMSRETNPSSRRRGESCCRHFRPQIPVIFQGQRNRMSIPCG